MFLYLCVYTCLLLRVSSAVDQPARPKASSAGVLLADLLAPCLPRPGPETAPDLLNPSSPTLPTTTARPNVLAAAASPGCSVPRPRTPRIPPPLPSASNSSRAPGKVRHHPYTLKAIKHNSNTITLSKST